MLFSSISWRLGSLETESPLSVDFANQLPVVLWSTSAPDDAIDDAIG
jgi:hypothetical protein